MLGGSCIDVRRVAIVTTSKVCYRPLQSNTCPWVCNDGFFMVPDPLSVAGFQCRECNYGRCPVGFFLSLCTATSNAICMPCSNPKPPDTHYVSDGGFASDSADREYFIGTCAWACDDGYFVQGWTPNAVCTSAEEISILLPSSCGECSNKPPNSAYVGPGPLYNIDICPWDCNPGYSSNGTVCLPFNAEGCQEIATGASPEQCLYPALLPLNGGAVMGLVNGPGIANVSGCYPWQYVSCVDGVLFCNNCQGLQLSPVVGGWQEHSFAGCGIGEYRAPCKSNCFSPAWGFATGPCTQCSNALGVTNFHYISEGILDPTTGQGSCQWSCNPGYVKRNLTVVIGSVCARYMEACEVEGVPQVEGCNSLTWTASVLFSTGMYSLQCS